MRASKRYSFPTTRQMDDLYEKHVLHVKNKNHRALQKCAVEWMKLEEQYRVLYDVNWLGMPIIQSPMDMVVMQELIFREKPDVIVEVGVAHGGSIIYYASIFELLKHGKVIGIDIDIRKHNRLLIEKHPMSKRISLIEGNSVDDVVLSTCKKLIRKHEKVFVLLDGNHTRLHVLKELQLYSQFVTKGSFLIVFDTTMYYLAKAGYPKKIWKHDLLQDSPHNGVEDFLKSTKSFRRDSYYEKFYITYAMGGFLRKIR